MLMIQSFAAFVAITSVAAASAAPGASAAPATPASASAAPAMPTPTPAPPTPAALLQPALLAPEAYADTFTIIADLEDGTYVQAQLTVTNAGPGTAHGACRLTVVAPGQKARLLGVTGSRDDWHYDAGRDALQVKSCTLRATPSLAADLVLDGAVVQLSLSESPRRYEPPGHRVTAGSGSDAAFYDSQILVPFSEIGVYLALPGIAPRSLRGHAYADHSLSTMLPADLARGWLRFRGLGDGDCSTLLLARQPANASAPVAWLWQRRSGAPKALRLGGLPFLADGSEDSGEGSMVPFVLDPAMGELRIAPSAHLFRYAPLEELGLVGSIIGSWAGKLVTHTYRATLAGVPGCGAVAGILEIQTVSN